MERTVDGVFLRICFPFSHILVSHPCLCPQQSLNEYNRCCRKIGCVLMVINGRRSTQNFFWWDKNYNKNPPPLHCTHGQYQSTWNITNHFFFLTGISHLQAGFWSRLGCNANALEETSFGGKGSLSKVNGDRQNRAENSHAQLVSLLRGR